MSSAELTMSEIVGAAGAHVPRLLGLVEERLATLAASHGPILAEHAGHTIAAGGKRMRPLLVVLAAGPQATREAELIAAAAAVELIHSATLVHDDVLDGAQLRRGVPTVWSQGGRQLAVATGDLLFSRAFSELTAVGSLAAVRSLSRATSALAEGELLQRQDAWNAAVSVERYLLRCELKTARLFEAACEMGGQVARCSDRHIAELAAFGRAIGLAFQLLDDVIDVAGPASLTGKQRGADLLDGTVTLPLILARERDAQLAAVDLRTVTTPAQAEELCARIAQTDALRDSQARALQIVAQAKRALDDLGLDDGQRAALSLVASSVADRKA
ncbi:MAG: polyprenyl synthetase family protein [Thermoleophilia bacterium]